MPDGEKLLDLICGSPAIKCGYPTGDCKTCHTLADHLIANGVVVREKGEWVYDHWCEFKCSKCGALSKTEPRGEENFCPNCGSDMRAEEQNRARSDCDSVDICIECWDEWLEMPAKDGDNDG